MDLTPDQSATLETCLSPGEKILWTDRPDTRIRFGFQDILFIPCGLILLALITAWIVVALRAGSPCMAAAILPGGVMILPMFLARPWLNARQRSRKIYVVTDRRALIMHRANRIRSIDLATIGNISLRESRDGSGTITFGPFNPFVLVTPVGVPTLFPIFESLPGARRVFERILQARQTAREAAAPAAGVP